MLERRVQVIDALREEVEKLEQFGADLRMGPQLRDRVVERGGRLSVVSDPTSIRAKRRSRR